MRGECSAPISILTNPNLKKSFSSPLCGSPFPSTPPQLRLLGPRPAPPDSPVTTPTTVASPAGDDAVIRFTHPCTGVHNAHNVFPSALHNAHSRRRRPRHRPPRSGHASAMGARTPAFAPQTVTAAPQAFHSSSCTRQATSSLARPRDEANPPHGCAALPAGDCDQRLRPSSTSHQRPLIPILASLLPRERKAL